MGLKVITSATEWGRILANVGNGVVVLDCFTTWCGPCKTIAPFFVQLSERFSDAVFAKLDCELDANRELVQQLQITAFPTFIFFVNGREQKRLRGASPAGLEQAVASVLEGFHVDQALQASVSLQFFQIKIKSLNPVAELSVQVQKQANVAELRREVCRQEPFEEAMVFRLKLIFRGQVLGDAERLADMGIESGSTVHALLGKGEAKQIDIERVRAETAVMVEQNLVQDVRKAVDLLRKVLRNIQENPGEVKFRSLKAENKLLRKTLFKPTNGLNLMLACGFEQTRDGSLFVFRGAEKGVHKLDQVLKVLKKVQQGLQENNQEMEMGDPRKLMEIMQVRRSCLEENKATMPELVQNLALLLQEDPNALENFLRNGIVSEDGKKKFRNLFQGQDMRDLQQTIQAWWAKTFY